FKASGHDLKHLIRCFCNSAAYQRTSRPVTGNEDDKVLFSHMTVKVLSPEVLYDSLLLAMGVDDLGEALRPPPQPQRGPALTGREQFVNFFTTKEEGDDPNEFGFGIPQMLRLMNSAVFNKTTPVVEKLSTDAADRDKAIEGLFLTVLARRPTAVEAKKMADYV